VEDVDAHLHPYWLLLHAEDVENWLHEVTVPVQGIVPLDQMQPV